ncbi:hypothetical protein F7Q99_25250 [Streptomyces kaniharaensis]|uniref:ACT domain-containing protein n=1 Tax=Streptomyces kaniharaensis TaxID=212423 RepID=A0A6N7KV33_9ACTN|nr:hypothetical protein [Streptomyces kaniharaensis]MQS15486.1 hypothetical protein [Streptomyces kaniharaensis]
MEHTEHQTTAVSTSGTPAPSRAQRRGARTHRWRRDTVELAAVFLSVTAADLVAKIVLHGPDGPVVLAASAVALLATALFHTWWSHRHHLHGPPAPAPVPNVGAGPTALWRVRATVQDSPAGLARVCAAFAEQRVAIVSMQSHPLPDGSVDEFFLRAPHSLTPTDLATLVTTGGHDLLDTPVRVA